jgi:hypothetical protein
MEKNGIITNIITGVKRIAEGRRQLMTEGEAEEGLANFRKGHALVGQIFKDAYTSGDPELMLLAELVYNVQELAESTESEPVAQSSTEAAVRYFVAAMDTFPIVHNLSLYRAVNTAFSPHPAYRYRGFPKDAVHAACASDITRIKNALRRIGIPEADISLADVRTAMLHAAQESYCALQREVLPINNQQ